MPRERLLNSDVIPLWASVLISLFAGIAISITWAYATFTPSKQSDAIANINDARMTKLESNQQQMMNRVGELNGKMDYLIDMQRKR